MSREENMGNANSTLALLSSSEFKWTAEIQYMESLENRDEAIRYASQHGCNLIVKYEKRKGPQFDVMIDPQSRWTSQADSGQSQSGPAGRKRRGILGMFGLSRRMDANPAGASQH
jgi:hypothetical protein